MKKILSVVALSTILVAAPAMAGFSGGGRSFSSSPSRSFSSSPTKSFSSSPSRSFSSSPTKSFSSKPSSVSTRHTNSHKSSTSNWWLIPILMDDEEQEQPQDAPVTSRQQEDCDLEDILTLDFNDCL